MAKEPNDRLWKWLLHTEAVFNARTNFFLVAQSIGIIAYATLATTLGHRYWVDQLAIVVLGIAITIAWYLVQIRTFRRLGEMIKLMNNEFPLYKTINDQVPGTSNNRLMGEVLPLYVFMPFWLAILFIHLSRMPVGWQVSNRFLGR